MLLEATTVQVGNEPEDEYQAFARLLRMRHAIACGLKLKPILEAIERGVSQTSEIVRSESKGAIYGQLDIPLYLNRRSTNLSWPRTFPVLIEQATPNTPENQLVVDSLRELVRRLIAAGALEVSAERAYCNNLLRWGREQLHAEPWISVVPVRSAQRLRRETDHRLRKRQTGNEPAYSKLLDWHSQWLFDASRSSPNQTEDFINLLLAFPPGDFFEDRVFEIWCLHQVIEAFRRCGAIVLAGPRLLSERLVHSICDMQYENYRFEVWFQKSLPSTLANWRYTHSEKPLRGIPDITVIGEDDRRLLIDAKRREVHTQTRSEETYKMLGYVENFRSMFEGTPFWGALCFLSDSGLFTEIKTEGGHRLVLVGAHTADPNICALGSRMDTLVSEWLSLQRANPVLEEMKMPIRLM